MLFFVVNGRGPTLNNETGGADLSESGFAMGVPGCPFPPFTPAGTLIPSASYQRLRGSRSSRWRQGVNSRIRS